MRALVTGAAGFIGSHLVDALLDDGHEVVGVDAFTDYYAPETKRTNLARARDHQRFRLVEADLRRDGASLDGIDTVFHLAGQPGVRLSWSTGFATYDSCNVLATQRLLESIKIARDREPATAARVVFASSSSIYGNAPRYPTHETDLPAPHSPYAVTKLAAEHLCALYAANWGVPAMALRYFTVYGPRQRPDMAMHGLIRAGIDGTPFPLFGDGRHIRDFTFVGDVVRATMLAATVAVEPGTVMNVAGGGSTSMTELVDLVGELLGTPVPVERQPARAGDVERTGGAIDRARELLGWEPATELRTGICRQIEALRAAQG